MRERQTPKANHFTKHTITQRRPDGSTKERVILDPDEEARAKQAEMLEFFQKRGFIDHSTLPPTVSIGGMPGTSLMDNITPHKDNWSFYMVDIKDAFPSVSIFDLHAKFDAFYPSPSAWQLVTKPGHEKETTAQRNARLADWQEAFDKAQHFRRNEQQSIDDFLTFYGTAFGTPGLPLGSLTSPYLFNFYWQETDKALAEYSVEHDLAYTRFFDDLTFSSPDPKFALGKKMRGTLRDIIESTPNMHINHQKSRVQSRVERPVTITGMSIYPDGRIQPKPELLQLARNVFDVMLLAAQRGDKLTDWHASVVDGYHSILSLASEPHNRTMRRAEQEYRVTARAVHAAIELDNEPPLAERVAARRQRVEDYVAAIEATGIVPEVTLREAEGLEQLEGLDRTTSILLSLALADAAPGLVESFAPLDVAETPEVNNDDTLIDEFVAQHRHQLSDADYETLKWARGADRQWQARIIEQIKDAFPRDDK